MADQPDLFILADEAYEAGDHEKAFGLFSLAAEQGDSSAMSRIALMYFDGDGVHRDFDKSIYWDLRAIEAGSVSSMTNLAITYRNCGDAREARKWFEKAIDAGDVEAALDLAKMLMVSDKEWDRIKVLLKHVTMSDVAIPYCVEEAQRFLDEMEENFDSLC